MSRQKFQTLTEQMYYVLLCLRRECCGTDIMEMIKTRTGGRVQIGPGTLYHLLDQFLTSRLIEEAKVEGRKRSYRLTTSGQELLQTEYRRLQVQIQDYDWKFDRED